MNKLEKYKKDFSGKPDYKSGWLSTCVEEGFDAAMALDLAIKFHLWSRHKHIDEKGLNIIRTGVINNKSEEEVAKELYKYWLDNIYDPEI